MKNKTIITIFLRVLKGNMSSVSGQMKLIGRCHFENFHKNSFLHKYFQQQIFFLIMKVTKKTF